MGAIFLYETDSSLDPGKAKSVFARKGFGKPSVFALGKWTLLLYRKMLFGSDNHLEDAHGNLIASCGTVVYRGYSYSDSLAQLLADYRSGQIALDQLRGNFFLLFWDGCAISMLTDSQNAQHMFINDVSSCVSSSFMALLAASPGSLRLNRSAAVEKLATGCIIAPDTLVEGIYKLDDRLLASLNRENGLKVLNRRSREVSPELHCDGFRASINRQITVLREYFSDIQKLHETSSGELGLSSGYDSRLLLALSLSFNDPIPLHTHSTGQVHDAEVEIVKRLAAVKKNCLTIVPTRQMEDMTEEQFCRTLYDNLYFFDGRCCNDMGSYSETYTADYRRRVLGAHNLSFNGLGGEIFRNGYGASWGRFSWVEWMNWAVFYPYASDVAGGRKDSASVASYISEKIARMLGMGALDTVNAFMTRAYYGLVRMPDCASTVANAYNQVAFTLIPFIERPIVTEALKGSPYIGCGGAYQAAMITELSAEHAAIGSHYGFPFASVPLSDKARSLLRCCIPLSVRHLRARRLNRGIERNVGYQRYLKRRSESRLLQDVEAVLHDAFPAVDWSVCTRHYAQRWTTLSVGLFLKEFQSKLKW